MIYIYFPYMLPVYFPCSSSTEALTTHIFSMSSVPFQHKTFLELCIKHGKYRHGNRMITNLPLLSKPLYIINHSLFNVIEK